MFGHQKDHRGLLVSSLLPIPFGSRSDAPLAPVGGVTPTFGDSVCDTRSFALTPDVESDDFPLPVLLGRKCAPRPTALGGLKPAPPPLTNPEQGAQFSWGPALRPSPK